MITKITGEQPFQVLTSNFSISPSQEGYTLQISADGVNYSNLFTVGAGVTRLVTGVAANSFYRLSGNQSQVSINWMKTCVTEGGSGGAGNELTPVTEFPLGAEAGTVVALASGDTYGIYQYDGTDWNPAGGEVDLSAYWTSAETQSAITAVEDHLFDVEQVTASALTELHDGLLEVSASTSGKADAVNIEPNTGYYSFPEWNEQGIVVREAAKAGGAAYKVNGKTHYAWTQDAEGYTIYAPMSAGTAGEVLVSSGPGNAPVWSAVTGGGGDMSNYWNSAETKSYVDSAASNLQDQLDIIDNVIPAAILDLNNRVDAISAATPDFSPYWTSAQTQNAISAATQDMVTSTDVKHMVKLTQAQYDALVQGGTVDPYTFYIITLV